jgi:hypothetical protein
MVCCPETVLSLIQFKNLFSTCAINNIFKNNVSWCTVLLRKFTLAHDLHHTVRKPQLSYWMSMQQFCCNECRWFRQTSSLWTLKLWFSWRFLQSSTNFDLLHLVCTVCLLSSYKEWNLRLKIFLIYLINCCWVWNRHIRKLPKLDTFCSVVN